MSNIEIDINEIIGKEELLEELRFAFKLKAKEFFAEEKNIAEIGRIFLKETTSNAADIVTAKIQDIINSKKFEEYLQYNNDAQHLIKKAINASEDLIQARVREVLSSKMADEKFEEQICEDAISWGINSTILDGIKTLINNKRI